MSNRLKRLSNQINRKGKKLRCRRCGKDAQIGYKDGYGYVCMNCGKTIVNLGDTERFDVHDINVGKMEEA